jgi:hypothetical protein
MSKVQLQGNVSGTGVFTIASPNSNTDRTLTLPDSSGTIGLSGAAVTRSQMPSGAILQVVFAQKKDTQSISATGGIVEISGLSASITPTTTSSRILIQTYVMIATSNGASLASGLLIYRDGSNLTGAVGNAAGSRPQVWLRNDNYVGMSSLNSFNTDHGPNTFGGFYVDSPVSTSSLTYSIRFRPQTNSANFVVNRTQNDSDVNDMWGSRPTSGLILMEIA